MTDTIDPRERRVDDLEMLQSVMDGRQAQIHTGMPGTIVSFNGAAMTAVVQPNIQAIRTMQDGTRQIVTIEPIQDVPVFFPGGGGHTLTFPVAAGDQCWISFSERSIDYWFQHGGVQQPSDWRMHDITDAVAHVGLRSQAGLPTGGAAPGVVQLRSDDGKTVVQVDGPNNAITLYAASDAQVLVDGKNTAVFVQGENTTIGLSGGNLGILGAAPIPKGVITGTKGGNVALTNLIHFLADRGDITDETT